MINKKKSGHVSVALDSWEIDTWTRRVGDILLSNEISGVGFGGVSGLMSLSFSHLVVLQSCVP